jgi:twitching motility protein PilT
MTCTYVPPLQARAGGADTTRGGADVLDLDGLLRFAVEQGASDVHVKVGSRPRLRVDGRLREGPFDTIEPADTERVAAGIIPRG